ncbi:MAG: hypothetical protein AABX93_01465 [Nanoarchaeota archaeon]
MINFKKISAIAGSGLMIGMTMGVAAAANYPAPFVAGGAADVAIVYGTGSGVSILDAVEAGSIQANLQSFMTGKTSTTGSVSGEAIELFTSGTKLYINDPINTVKSVLTKSELPTVLADGSFSGNVDATYTAKIDISKTARAVFQKQPTSSEDPILGINFTSSTGSGNYLYNATITFNKAINFSHSDSEGESLNILGTEYTVAAATDADTLVLLKSAEKLDLNSDAPSATVAVGGATYTVELISSSDSAATIKVTDSSGSSESKEIDEAASKKVNGITVAVTTADETNLRLSASVVVGSDKLTIENNVAVEVGEDETGIDGAIARFGNGTEAFPVGALSALTFSIYASESDKDAVRVGESFVDPVSESFKVDFAGVNIDADSTARETIRVTPSGDEKMEVKFTDHRDFEKTVTWAVNTSSNLYLAGAGKTELKNITVSEGSNTQVAQNLTEYINHNEYVVVGNEDEGYLLRLTTVKNSTADDGTLSSSTEIEFTDEFSGDKYSVKGTSISAAGVGTVIIGGKSYTVTMFGSRGISQESYNVTLNYPDSAGNALVLYPTIETGKGAKISFYRPLQVYLRNAHSRTGTIFSSAVANVSSLEFPDGDGYTSVAVHAPEAGNPAVDSQWAFGGTNLTINTTGNSVTVSVGKLLYNVTSNAVAGSGVSTDQANDTVTIYLVNPGLGGNIVNPAIIVWEEKDDNNEYQAQVIELDPADSDADDIGVNDVEDTYSNESGQWETTRYSDSKFEDAMDLWGTITTIDSTDSDQKTATISYPDEQVNVQLYFAADESAITAGGVSGGATQLGDVLVKDSEVSSVSSKNLVVVGGSCINSVAANLVDAGCGSAFTDSTGVGSGQFLIQSFGDAYTTGKVALLVAGYDVSDTVNAAKYLRTQTVKTDASTKYVGTSSTSAELQTTETSA